MAEAMPLQVYCVRKWIIIVLLVAFPLSAVRPEEVFGVTSSYARAQRTVLKVDTKKKVLLVYRGNALYRKYSVALGKQATPTPVGAWKVIDKQKNWGSGFGTRWIGLNVPWGIYGIHGTNKPYSIGYFTSGGCIRMHVTAGLISPWKTLLKNLKWLTDFRPTVYSSAEIF